MAPCHSHSLGFLLLIFIGALITTLAQGQIYSANNFQSGLFKFNSLPSGIYEINVGDITGQFMMAYADFDGDKNTDMVTLSAPVDGLAKKQSIFINLWSTSSGKFASYELDQISLKCQGTIVNIIPGDINYDGKLDFVAVTKTSSKEYCLDFVKQIECSLENNTVNFSLFEFSSSIGPLSLNRQPIAGDFTGQHYFQLLVYNTHLSLSKPVRIVYEFISDTSVKLYEFNNLISREDGCLNYANHVNFADPNFSSIVDFSGDCRADLVLHTETGIEFWEKSDSRLLCLVQIQTFDRQSAELISLNFADINFDGSVDMIALVKDTSNSSTPNFDLVILYNKFTVSSSSLCSQFSQFPYENIALDGRYVQYQQLDLQVFQNSKGVSPPQVRFADIDWDGMPDIVVTRERMPSNANYGQPVVLMNVACDNSLSECMNLSVAAKRRFQESNNSNFSAMNAVETTNIAFFDINEDGKIDFLINSIENGQLSIRCFYNYVSTDAFFLKALSLNGQCSTQACQSAVYYGATVQCKVTTLDTNYKVGTGTQLSQSASCPLQLPFVILGLARTNNYIENFTVGLPQSDNEDSIHVWSPIIPNSQLIIYPETDKTINWQISIFVQPNDALLIVIFVSLVILTFLGAIIAYYHRKEKEYSKQDQDEFLKMIR